MKMRRPLFTPVVLALLVWIMGGLVGGGTPALAATTTLVVPISGTVDGLPESVSLSGNAQIKSTPAPNPTPGLPPAIILSIRLLNVTGQGLSTGTKYVAPDEDILIRPLVVSDLIEIPLPFFPSSPGGILEARSALGSFTLSFDVMTGDLTGATASLSTPNF